MEISISAGPKAWLHDYLILFEVDAQPFYNPYPAGRLSRSGYLYVSNKLFCLITFLNSVTRSKYVSLP